MAQVYHYSADGNIYVIREGNVNDINNTIREATLFLNQLNSLYSYLLCENQVIVGTPTGLRDYLYELINFFASHTNVVVEVTDNGNESWHVHIEFDWDGTEPEYLPTLIISTPRNDLSWVLAQDAIIGFVPSVADCPPVPDPVVCDTCERLTAPACDVTYSIIAGLDGNTNYYITMEDMFNRKYTQTVLTDANGNFVIDASAVEFPAGFFTPDAGGLTIKVYSDEELTDQQTILNNSTEYSCIQLGFQYITTTTSSYTPDFEHLIDDFGRRFIDDNLKTFITG